MTEHQIIRALSALSREILALELKRADLNEATHSRQRAAMQAEISRLYRYRDTLRRQRHKVRGYYV